MYLTHDEGYMVAASAAGSDKHPGWYYNLEKDPDIEIELDGEIIPVRARIAEGEERDELYKRFEEFSKTVCRLPEEDLANDPGGGFGHDPGLMRRSDETRPGRCRVPRHWSVEIAGTSLASALSVVNPYTAMT